MCSSGTCAGFGTVPGSANSLLNWETGTSCCGSCGVRRATIFADCYNSSLKTCSLTCLGPGDRDGNVLVSVNTQRKRNPLRNNDPHYQATNWWKSGGSPSECVVRCLDQDGLVIANARAGRLSRSSRSNRSRTTTKAKSTDKLLAKLERLLAEA